MTLNGNFSCFTIGITNQRKTLDLLKHVYTEVSLLSFITAAFFESSVDDVYMLVTKQTKK